MKVIFITFLSLITISAQSKILIKGYVNDEYGKAVAFANVFFEGTFEGAMTDEHGYFEFSSSIKDKATLNVSIIGYEKYKMEINVADKNVIELNIILKESAVKLRETVVTASSYGTEKEKGIVISRIDVLTTPGGAADLYQSLKTMPGITQVSESAELYVRGGDPLETITMINQTPVYHPYTFESSYGGIFSNLRQSAIKSIYFTSGGFSAKYGNVLSGVLDIDTRDLPINTGGSIGLSLANFELSLSISSKENNFGFYSDYSQNFTKPIFWLNGGLDRMTVTPTSKNFTAGTIYKYSKSDRLKVFMLIADDKQGINVERAEYNGVFNGNSSNFFLNIQSVNLMADNFMIKSGIGYNKFSNSWLFGILDIRKTENVISFRSDAEYQLSKDVKLIAGLKLETRKISYEGRIPNYDFDIRPEAKSLLINAIIKENRAGFYSEAQASNFLGVEKLSLAAGIRYDKIIHLNSNWTDPRLSVSYKISEKSTLRFGAGIFRQIPDPRLYNPNEGNPDLKPMKASHYVISYEYNPDDNNSFRLELYSKYYDNLPAKNDLTNYDNSGYGYARGIDLIYKGIFPYGITGWLSYGYIDTKRKWMDYDSFTRSSFDITHNLNLIFKYNLTDNYQLGITLKYATGRPYTPVIAASY